MQNLLKSSFCVAIAWGAAMAMTLVMYFAYWPSRINVVRTDELFWIALLGAIYIAAIPLLVLGWISLRRTPSTLHSTAIACSWLLAVFLLRAARTWYYHGEFPSWMFLRDFIQPLPLSLTVGLVFGLAARRVLGPNYSFKPSPLRGLA